MVAWNITKLTNVLYLIFCTESTAPMHHTQLNTSYIPKFDVYGIAFNRWFTCTQIQFASLFSIYWATNDRSMRRWVDVWMCEGAAVLSKQIVRLVSYMFVYYNNIHLNMWYDMTHIKIDCESSHWEWKRMTWMVSVVIYMQYNINNTSKYKCYTLCSGRKGRRSKYHGRMK